MAESSDLAALLAHADWLRGLARKLVGGDAEDAVQETYAAALHSPPDPALPPRPWLARVLRNATRMAHRTASRRSKREQAVVAIAEPSVATDDAVGRAEAFRMLTELVLALADPYRTTLIRHYFDGDSFAVIARRDRIPEATVRGRHKHALAQLRTKLDARAERSAWLASLAPLAAPHPTSLVGAFVVNKILIAIVVALVAGGIAWKTVPRAATSAAPVAVATPRTATLQLASPPKHVQQLAPVDRAKLVEQIALARAKRTGLAIPQGPTTSTGGETSPELHVADMDHEAIRDAMREVIPFLAQCYEDNRESLHADHLQINAHLTLTGDPDVGMVIDAKQLFDDNDRALPPKIDDCLRSTLQTLELPPLGDGDTVEVNYPLLFADAPPDGSLGK